MKPTISIITVNFNGLKDTIGLIESLNKIETISFEIIVVDNSSNINEALIIKNKYPYVITIRSEINLGFSGGNNLGIKQACGEYIFLLNNDTFIEEDNIHYLVERLNKKDCIGAVSPKIKYAIEPRRIQFAGFTSLSKITLRNKTIGQGCQDGPEFNIPFKVPYCHGAAMMIKKSVIEKVGYMPKYIFYITKKWIGARR